MDSRPLVSWSEFLLTEQAPCLKPDLTAHRTTGQAPEWLRSCLSDFWLIPRTLAFVDAFSGPKAGLSTAVEQEDLKTAAYDKLLDGNGQDVLTWAGFMNLCLLILQVMEGSHDILF